MELLIDELNNYGPISLLSIFEKIMEKLMHKRLYEFLQEHPLSKSIWSIDNKKYGCGIFIDLHKAF